MGRRKAPEIMVVASGGPEGHQKILKVLSQHEIVQLDYNSQILHLHYKLKLQYWQKSISIAIEKPA